MNSSRVQFTMYSPGLLQPNFLLTKGIKTIVWWSFFLESLMSVSKTFTFCKSQTKKTSVASYYYTYHHATNTKFTSCPPPPAPLHFQHDVCSLSKGNFTLHTAAIPWRNPQRATETQSGEESIFGAMHVLQIKNMAVTWSKACDNPWTALLL